MSLQKVSKGLFTEQSNGFKPIQREKRSFRSKRTACLSVDFAVEDLDLLRFVDTRQVLVDDRFFILELKVAVEVVALPEVRKPGREVREFSSEKRAHIAQSSPEAFPRSVEDDASPIPVLVVDPHLVERHLVDVEPARPHLFAFGKITCFNEEEEKEPSENATNELKGTSNGPMNFAFSTKENVLIYGLHQFFCEE